MIWWWILDMQNRRDDHFWSYAILFKRVAIFIMFFMLENINNCIWYFIPWLVCKPLSLLSLRKKTFCFKNMSCLMLSKRFRTSTLKKNFFWYSLENTTYEMKENTCFYNLEKKIDRAERHDFGYSFALFPPRKRGKKKRGMK